MKLLCCILLFIQCYVRKGSNFTVVADASNKIKDYASALNFSRMVVFVYGLLLVCSVAAVPIFMHHANSFVVTYGIC